ncbi:MAG: energy transducer TonB [Rhodoferax sp.]|nr:energy transducer TonB [Rhodoferax sp.]
MRQILTRRWLRASLLQRALAVSLALHVALLTVRFVSPQDFDRMFADRALEVVLVNARSEIPPEEAQAVAQASLAGGGEAAQGMASSMTANTPLSQVGDLTEAESAAVRQNLQQQQTVLLNRVKQQLDDLAKAQARSSNSPEERAEQEKKRREMVKLLAKIENRINAENARPRKRYLSPAVREASYALYYDTMRQAIESRGTTYFPEKSGKKLYGSLTMVITVDHRGMVLEAEVAHASGNADLDRRAQEIARKAGPFGPFTPEMRKTVDQLVVVSRFTFTKDATLQTKAMVPP